MKSVSIKTILGTMAFTTLGLSAALAHADGWPGYDRGYDRGYGQPESRGPAPVVVAPAPDARFAMHEGWRFAREVNARRDRQMDQILDGLESDRLTREEFIALMREQRSIRELERAFMADRFMTPGEFQRLMQALDGAERNIQMALNNRDYRRYARPWFWGR